MPSSSALLKRALQSIAVVSWFAAGCLFVFAFMALGFWPTPIGATTGAGEITSAWALNAAVLVGSSGFFLMAMQTGPAFKWDVAAIVVAAGALFTSHPAFVGGWLLAASPFFVTATTLFFVGAAALRTPNLWRRRPAGAV